MSGGEAAPSAPAPPVTEPPVTAPPPAEEGASLLRRRLLHVSVEGNIGAGKSTLLLEVERQWDEGRAAAQAAAIPWELRTLCEPVADWMAPALADGQSMLSAFYEAPSSLAFTFQMFVMLTRLNQLRAARMACEQDDARAGHAHVLLTERCIASSGELFVRPAWEAGRMDEAQWHTYRVWEREARSQVEPRALDGVVYLRTPPVFCVTRISARKRPGEAGRVQAAYVTALHAAHEAYVERLRAGGTPVLVLDADPRSDGTADAVRSDAARVLGFLGALLSRGG